MPADLKIDRECRCTLCARTPRGYRLLKYGTYYKHRKQEEALQAQITYRAQVEAAEARMRAQVPAPLEHGYTGIGVNPIAENELDANGGEGADLPYQSPPPPDMHLPELPEHIPGHFGLSPSRSPEPQRPQTPLRLHTPTPPHSPAPERAPSPLPELEYDSDESESDYQPPFHAYLDPPNLRLAYLNAMSDHIVRKHSVRDVEISLRNSLNCLELTPNAIPDHITPLTTLKSIRQHLGLSTGSLLHRVPVCSKCYKRYTMEEVSQAELPATCTRERPPCTGTYMRLGTKQGEQKPMPAKVLLYTKIIPSLRLMFLRPSFVRLLSEGSAANQLPRAPDTLYDVCGCTQGPLGPQRI